MPRNSSPIDRARDAFRKAVSRAQIDARLHATIGWRKSATEVALQPPGRANYVYITKSDQTVTIALNRAGVPLQPFLPVWVVLENNTYVVVGRDNSNAEALSNVPDSDYGVPTHPHALSGLSDVLITSLADGQILAWDATAGKWVNVTEAGALVASVNGQTGAVVLDSDDIAEGSINLYISAAELIKLAGIETAADVTDQANVGAAIDTSPEQTVLASGNKIALTDAGVLK
jgi:hypothetical protein